MIKFKKYQNKNEESKAFNKWYGRAVHELVEFDEFINHMANHHCVFSEGVIRGVLIEMELCLRELLLEGKAVRMDDLGIFALSIANKPGGAAQASDYTADLITGVQRRAHRRPAGGKARKRGVRDPGGGVRLPHRHPEEPADHRPPHGP